MRRLAGFIVFAVAMFAVASPGHATLITTSAALSGSAEAPPNASPATGQAFVELDTVANTLHVVVTFSGLTAPNTAAHIHCCVAVPLSGTAGVATVTPTFTGFPSGVTSGSYDHLFDLTDASSWNAAFITANGGSTAGAEAALIAGLSTERAYLNIHTQAFPGGEIRGFLVPGPSTLTVFGLGLVGLALSRRRRLS